jgi:hypothetical protein
VTQSVTGDNVNPNNNLDHAAHDFHPEVPLVMHLRNLIGYHFDAFVLVLELILAVLLISLSFSISEIGNVSKCYSKICVASTVNVEKRRHGNERSAGEQSE